MRHSKPMMVALLVLALAPGCTGSTSAPPAVTAAARPTEPGAPPEIDRTTPLPDPLPTVAADVNGHPVPTYQVKLLAERALQSGNIPADQKAFAYRQAMNQFIIRELLFEESVARGLSADQAALEQTENAERGRYANAAAWQAALTERGMTEESFKMELRTQHTVNALVQQVHAGVPADSVTEAELLLYYEGHAAEFTSRDRVRAAHILIRFPAGAAPVAKAAARSKAETLLAGIRKGADFAELAKKNSGDPASRARGGEMLAFGRGQLGPELAALEQAIYALTPGEVGGAVIESPAGFHVVKLLAKLPDEVVPLDSVKEQLRQHLLRQKRADALQKLVNSLRAKAKIETHL